MSEMIFQARGAPLLPVLDAVLRRAGTQVPAEVAAQRDAESRPTRDLVDRDHPDRFVNVVERFIDSTQPADYDQDLLRSLLRTGIREATASEAADAAPRGA